MAQEEKLSLGRELKFLNKVKCPGGLDGSYKNPEKDAEKLSDG